MAFDEESITDPPALTVNFHVVFGSLEDPSDSARPLEGWIQIPENGVLETYIPSMVQSTAIHRGNPAWIRKAVVVTHTQDAQIMKERYQSVRRGALLR